MIDAPFRAHLPRFVKPLIWIYQKLGLTPNAITLMALALAGGAAALCAIGSLWWALAFWWFGRLLDGTDGIYARETGQATPFGAYLDIVADMGAYSIMIVGFAVFRPELSLHWLLIVLLYVLCITSALAFGAMEVSLKVPVSDNRGLRLGAGLAEGGETGIAYTVFLLFPEHLSWTTKIWIGILVVTVVSRSLIAKRMSQS